MKHYGVAIPAWANQASPPLMPFYNQELEVTWSVWWVFFGSGFHNTQWCIIWIEKNISEFMCSSLALSGQLRFRSWIRSELRRHHHAHGGSPDQMKQHMKPWSNVHQHELGECLTSTVIYQLPFVGHQSTSRSSSKRISRQSSWSRRSRSHQLWMVSAWWVCRSRWAVSDSIW